MSKTINQALKDLFLGLGGDASALADNKDISDYIDDLESAIKATAAKELPTPAEANVGKVATVIEDEGAYSWGAENVPTELPTPAVGDIGKVVSVVSDGESGAEYALETPASDDIISYLVTKNSDGEQTVTLPDGVTYSDIGSLIEQNKKVCLKVKTDGQKYEVYNCFYHVGGMATKWISFGYDNTNTVTFKFIELNFTSTWQDISLS